MTFGPTHQKPNTLRLFAYDAVHCRDYPGRHGGDLELQRGGSPIKCDDVIDSMAKTPTINVNDSTCPIPDKVRSKKWSGRK